MDVPGRILAIDPGSRRLGFALSDALQQTARALEVWTRKGLEADLAHVRALVETHEVGELLVGLPRRLDGSESPTTARARALAAALEAAFPELPVVLRDEALTTWDAETRLREAGVAPKRRRALIDAYAALVLLEEALADRGGAPIG
jgi:putative Holliday junction resolvase